jgi:drug/metabolite transporter (DMT)-like permease
MALPPVIILPISYLVFKEKIGWQAILGTILAIAGVAAWSSQGRKRVRELALIIANYS